MVTWLKQDPSWVSKVLHSQYLSTFRARPGAMHTVFERLNAFDQDAIDNKGFIAQGKLTALGGQADADDIRRARRPSITRAVPRQCPACCTDYSADNTSDCRHERDALTLSAAVLRLARIPIRTFRRAQKEIASSDDCECQRTGDQQCKER
jgi:hypothetical protein